MDFKEWHKTNEESLAKIKPEERLKMAFMAGKRDGLVSILIKMKGEPRLSKEEVSLLIN